MSSQTSLQSQHDAATCAETTGPPHNIPAADHTTGLVRVYTLISIGEEVKNGAKQNWAKAGYMDVVQTGNAQQDPRILRDAIHAHLKQTVPLLERLRRKFMLEKELFGAVSANGVIPSGTMMLPNYTPQKHLTKLLHDTRYSRNMLPHVWKNTVGDFVSATGQTAPIAILVIDSVPRFKHRL